MFRCELGCPVGFTDALGSLYHYSQQACGVEMLQDYDCPYATCAGPPKETAYARLQHWMHKHAAKEYGSAGYGVIDEACEMVSPSQALVHNSNIRDGDKVVLIYLFQCTARNSTRWPISKKGAIPTGRLSTAQLVRIWKDFTSFVQTRVPSQYLTVLDTPPNPNLQVMLHTTWPGTAMSLPDSADDADEEGAMRDLRPKVSARAFTRSKAYEQSAIVSDWSGTGVPGLRAPPIPKPDHLRSEEFVPSTSSPKLQLHISLNAPSSVTRLGVEQSFR